MLENVKTPPSPDLIRVSPVEEPDWARFIETCLPASLPPFLVLDEWDEAGITVSCRFLLLSVRSNQSDAERTKR